MNSADIKAVLDRTEAAIAPTLQVIAQLRVKLAEALSREFIAANNITRADVADPDAPGLEHFGTVWAFANWLRIHSTKNWAAWNGRIYRASDLINGRMPDMPGRLDDLA